MVQISFRTDDEIRDLLRLETIRSGKSQNEVITEALIAHLSVEKDALEKRSRKQWSRVVLMADDRLTNLSNLQVKAPTSIIGRVLERSRRSGAGHSQNLNNPHHY
jgi:hypothetical protein